MQDKLSKGIYHKYKVYYLCVRSHREPLQKFKADYIPIQFVKISTVII